MTAKAVADAGSNLVFAVLMVLIHASSMMFQSENTGARNNAGDKSKIDSFSFSVSPDSFFMSYQDSS